MSLEPCKRSFTRYPVVSHGAEYLVMGHLMRRNILAYKAPPNNEGYDLICIHPDPRTRAKQMRVQVKSRLATDCDRGFPVKAASFDAFDYLVVAFLNVGYFMQMRKRHGVLAGLREPEFYTFPVSFIREHHDTSSSWHKVQTRRLDITAYKNGAGFEQIAKDLGILYPDKAAVKRIVRHDYQPCKIFMLNSSEEKPLGSHLVIWTNRPWLGYPPLVLQKQLSK